MPTEILHLRTHNKQTVLGTNYDLSVGDTEGLRTECSMQQRMKLWV